MITEVSRPSPLRISVASGVIAAHLAGLLLLSLVRPEALELPVVAAPKVIKVDFIRPEPVVPVVPPPMPSAPPRAPVRVTPETIPVAPVVAVESAFVLEAALPVDRVSDALEGIAAVDDSPGAVGVGGVPALSLLFGPEPPYPARAKRLGLQGEVLLRIHVGTDGLPREVGVVRGSGHVELDRSARNHVLRYWRFAPMQHEAVAEVPIRFALL